MLKRIAGLITVGFLAYIFLTGTVTQANDDEATIRILYYWGDTDSDVSARYLKDILDNEFEEAFPNVELIQETYDNETYKRKIRVLMAADELPDIMFGYGGGFSQVYAEKGKLLFLDDYIDDFYKEHMNMEMQENFIYDGKQYGICFSYWIGVLYCNRTLFEQVGVDIPETYEELLEACVQLRLSGIEPIACGMLNRWQGQQWINNFTMQLGGAKLYNAMAKEEHFNNQALTTAAQLTADLVEADAFSSNMFQISSGEAEEMFLNGEAAMIYIGSWFTNSAEECLGDSLEVAKMPVVPGALENGDYHGGGVNGWMVSAETQYPELATDIVSWLSYRLSCYQPENATFKIEEGDEATKTSETSQKILDLYSDKKQSGIAWDTLMRPEITDIWLEMCSELFEEKLSGERFTELLVNRILQDG